MPRRSAITLLDVTITVMLLGIVAAIAVPRFSSSLSAREVEAAARLIASDLNYLRSQAITRSKTVTVTVDSNQRSLTSADADSPSHHGTFQRQLDATISSATLTVDFDGGNSLSFNIFGRPEIAGTALVAGTIQVSSGAKVWQVTIDPRTGLAASSRP